jgi:hypothetical protein
MDVQQASASALPARLLSLHHSTSAHEASSTARSKDARLSTPTWLSSVIGPALNRRQTRFATYGQPFRHR